MGLREKLGSGPAAIDTVVFIHWIEESPKFVPVLEPIFVAVAEGELPAVTSALTLLEVLVVPYRLGNLDLASRYEAFLTRSRGLRMVGISVPVLRTAAGLRARFPALRTPDSLQIATALVSNCKYFLTNDRRLPALPGIETVSMSGSAR